MHRKRFINFLFVISPSEACNQQLINSHIDEYNILNNYCFTLKFSKFCYKYNNLSRTCFYSFLSQNLNFLIIS